MRSLLSSLFRFFFSVPVAFLVQIRWRKFNDLGTKSNYQLSHWLFRAGLVW
jgi:hypothetical protein